MRQVWHDLLFAHWPVATERLRPTIPAGLELDLHEGRAWVGVVPFRMSGIRLRLLPLDAPWLSAFPELNVRIYVTAPRGDGDDALERAAELKALLAESIARLKPRRGPSGCGDFGASDEWRYYNALYFPYVVGLKPYSRRAGPDRLDPAARQVLEWFRANVPERTLRNWQNAAAKLVARDLRAASLRVGDGRG